MPESKPPRLPLVALTVAHFTVDMQSSSIAVLIPLLRSQLHLDYGAAAAIVTAQQLTSSVIQPLFGLISDRRPVREVLPIACLLAGLGTATALFMPSYLWVLAVVIVTGLGSASFHAVAALNANYISGNKKATGISTFFAGGQFGYSVGPLVMVALITALGPRGSLLSAAPAVIGCLVLISALSYYASGAGWQARRGGRAAQATAASMAHTGRRRRMWALGLVVCVISVRSIIQTGLITFIPLYYAGSPGGKDYSAFLISVFVFTGALGTLFGGALADRFGRKLVLVLSVSIVLPLLFVFLRSSGVLQVISLAVSGASLISASSLTVVMAQELMPNNIGLASGLTLGLGFGMGGLGAAGLGLLADARGLPTTMLTLACLPLLLLLLSLMLPGDAVNRQPALLQPEPETPRL